MGETVVSLLFGLIDPFLWIKSMSTLGANKSKITYGGAYLGCYLLAVAKEFIKNNTNNNAIGICISAIMIMYIFITTITLFEGGIKEKIINVSVFFFMIFISELIVMGLFLLCAKHYPNLSFANFMVDFLCACVSRILLVIGCYFLYTKGKLMNFFYHSRECIPLVIINIVFNMLACGIITDADMKEMAHVILVFGIAQMVLLWYILYVSSIFKKKDRCIAELRQEINDNQKRQELIEQISHLKHDFPMHISIIKNLLYHEQYEKLNDYVDSTFETLEHIELLYNHPNITVGILISELTKVSQEMHVPFHSRIQVKEFGISNEDICCLLRNVVMNGLEAASKVCHETAHVSLQILYTMNGYEIQCINECIGMAEFEETSKKEKENHGYGVGIIRKIVKKNHGTMEMKCEETEIKGIGVVITTIQIPLKGRNGWGEDLL